MRMYNNMNTKFQSVAEFIIFAYSPNVFYKMCSLVDSLDYKLKNPSYYIYSIFMS